MAPLPPLGLAHAVKLVERGAFPIWLGSPHPTAAIVEQDGVFRIRDLVIDPEEASREREAALAEERSWLPEHHYALGKPTGAIHCEAASREDLIARMQRMAWPREW